MFTIVTMSFILYLPFYCISHWYSVALGNFQCLLVAANSLVPGSRVMGLYLRPHAPFKCFWDLHVCGF